MFDDMMIGRLVGPALIVVVVMIGMLIMSDGVYRYNDIMLYNKFELIWLTSPALFFITMRLISRIVSYELLDNDWVDVIIVLTAAQWYWNESVNQFQHENSTLIDEHIGRIGINEGWGISRTSVDVLHSFSFKEYGFHTDCIPGKCIIHTVIYLIEGLVKVTCQELCRYRHSRIVVSFIME